MSVTISVPVIMLSTETFSSTPWIIPVTSAIGTTAGKIPYVGTPLIAVEAGVRAARQQRRRDHRSGVVVLQDLGNDPIRLGVKGRFVGLRRMQVASPGSRRRPASFVSTRRTPPCPRRAAAACPDGRPTRPGMEFVLSPAFMTLRLIVFLSIAESCGLVIRPVSVKSRIRVSGLPSFPYGLQEIPSPGPGS